ncbi:zona pellucida sperm-binding protein 3-like [Dicentrarchus labrax]|uniref:Zona pellucida sperm-binding protein 3 n=1 Tax=Dicentrarchus labrax TaxID=13489 RepID=A0A8C4GFD7_DICLA|nr:zona pellucida sperm-binding protein 3-like [Dicentrarchus labrax]
MDHNFQRTSFWWIIVIVSVSTLTESRLAYSRGSSATTNSHIPSRTHGNRQRPLTAVNPQQSAELSAPRPRPVVVNCHPDSMEVVVQADMFDKGLQVDGRHLSLGSGSASEGSACTAIPSGEAEFTLRADLMDCGTKLSSTKEKIIYSNTLVYSPEPSSDGLLRLERAIIPVECHYEKRYAVDGISVHPTWVPFVSTASAGSQIDFYVLLMTDDWQFKRGSYSYYLGDPIHLEVSAVIGDHMPLRVYVDHCVATAIPDAEAALRYDFIENYGCLADAYLTNSSSHFLPRVEEHKLRFQLDAFRFYQEPSNQVYITCYVKAVPVLLAASSQNRACSLIDNRWRSVDGNDQACRSCDISHRVEEPESTASPKTTTNTKAWPHITPQESLVQNRPGKHTASYFRFRPELHQSQLNKPLQSSARLMKTGAESTAEQTIQLGPITVLSSSKIDTRPTDLTTALSPKNPTT